MLKGIFEGVTQIGEFKVDTDSGGAVGHDAYVAISEDGAMISFTLQQGPIKEIGVNGCQVDTIIEAAMMILQGLDEKSPCPENALAINSLENALIHLEMRKRDRTQRGTEGTNQL